MYQDKSKYHCGSYDPDLSNNIQDRDIIVDYLQRNGLIGSCLRRAEPSHFQQSIED